MKIGHHPEVPSALAQGAAAKAQQAKAASANEAGSAAGSANAAAKATAAGVPVTLSSVARGQAPTTGRLQGEFDAGKVKSVRAAIESGTFKVNAEAVADKLLTNSQEMLSRQSV